MLTFWDLAKALAWSSNWVWTLAKYSVRWMTVSLPAVPTGRSFGTAVGLAAAAVVGAPPAALPAAVVLCAAGVLPPPQAARTAVPSPARQAWRNARRENLPLK